MAIGKIEPTGTHIKHGYLKVRVDIYPTLTDKTYALHHVTKPIIPPEGYPGEVDELGTPIDRDDYNKWIENLPTKKELNPCLCHFIKVDANTTRAELEQIIMDMFDIDTVSQLDDILSEIDKPERRAELRQIMKPKSGRGKAIPHTANAKKLIGEANTRFKDLEVEVGSN